MGRSRARCRKGRRPPLPLPRRDSIGAHVMKNKIAVMLACAAAMAGAGCETEYPQLGKSVENMVQAQTLDPATAANPAALAPEGGDGQRIKNAMDVYFKD